MLSRGGNLEAEGGVFGKSSSRSFSIVFNDPIGELSSVAASVVDLAVVVRILDRITGFGRLK